MKNQEILIPYQTNQSLLRCPICHEGGRVEQASFICGNGHCYDISARGYLNFGQHQRMSQYSRGLFVSRQTVLASGLYAPVADQINAVIAEIYDGNPLAILDAGCGEGYFTFAVSQEWAGESGCRLFALDIERDAIQIACRKDRNTCWLVADMNNLPIADGQVDVLLNILSPANYAEFGRVLKAGGSLVKVVPGAGHLAEIRQSIAGQLKSPDYSNEDVVALFQKNVQISRMMEIRYQQPVEPELAQALFRMTPMTAKKDLTGIDLGNFLQITVHLHVLIGNKV